MFLLTSRSAVYMSELLWLYGSLDPRVRPLTFVIRRWAQTVGLTNPHPGRWITNFPLTLMVLFFLQQKTQYGFVLPSLKFLSRLAGEYDFYSHCQLICYYFYSICDHFLNYKQISATVSIVFGIESPLTLLFLCHYLANCVLLIKCPWGFQAVYAT